MMLRSDLRPKAALHLRPWLRLWLPLLAAMACTHSEPFQPTQQDPRGPLTTGSPRQVTFSSDPDLTPAPSGDGKSWLYTFTRRPNPVTIDFCLAGLPLDGGGQTRTFCDVSFGTFGLGSTVTWPAESPAGRLAYLRARGVPNGGATLSTDLILGSFNLRDSGQVLRAFPYSSSHGLIRSLSHLAWLNDHTLLFLATDVLHPGLASQDTVANGLQIERLDVDHPPATPDVMAGTDFASSVAPAADGSGFYFTLNGDSKVYRRTLGSGATTTVYDFGGSGVARDVRLADSVLYAVVGGSVIDSTLDGIVVQYDGGGILTRVDLRSGVPAPLDLPGLLARHPALSGDHTRLLVETEPAKDLWLVEVP